MEDESPELDQSSASLAASKNPHILTPKHNFENILGNF